MRTEAEIDRIAGDIHDWLLTSNWLAAHDAQVAAEAVADLRAKVEALHFPNDVPDFVNHCDECFTAWPCDTARAILGAES